MIADAVRPEPPIFVTDPAYAGFRDASTVTSISFVPADTIVRVNDSADGWIVAVLAAVLTLLILAVGWHLVELRGDLRERRRARTIGVAAVREALE